MGLSPVDHYSDNIQVYTICLTSLELVEYLGKMLTCSIKKSNSDIVSSHVHLFYNPTISNEVKKIKLLRNQLNSELIKSDKEQ